MHPYQGLKRRSAWPKSWEKKPKQTRIRSQTQIRDQKFSHEATQNQADYAAHVSSAAKQFTFNMQLQLQLDLQPEIFGNVWLMWI